LLGGGFAGGAPEAGGADGGEAGVVEELTSLGGGEVGLDLVHLDQLGAQVHNERGFAAAGVEFGELALLDFAKGVLPVDNLPSSDWLRVG